MPQITVVMPEKIRSLEFHKKHDGSHHLAAASGMITEKKWGFIIADDEHYLAMIDLTDSSHPIKITPIFSGDLPQGEAKRKKQKPDLEGLMQVTAPSPDTLQLLAVPSGSKKNRTKGRLITIQMVSASKGSAAPSKQNKVKSKSFEPAVRNLIPVDFAPLFRELKKDIPKLNIEGALDVSSKKLGKQVWLFHRGTQPNPLSKEGGSPNRVVILKRSKLFKELAREPVVLAKKLISETFALKLGRLNGLELTTSDATMVGDGQILLSASAEDTESTYDDGKVGGSALLLFDCISRKVLRVWPLKTKLKVEGLAYDKKQNCVFMVTDHDNRGEPAGLWVLKDLL